MIVELQDAVKAFQDAAQSIAPRMKASPFKTAWFIQGIGLEKSPSAFYRRVKSGDWTPQQVATFGYLLAGKYPPVPGT